MPRMNVNGDLLGLGTAPPVPAEDGREVMLHGVRSGGGRWGEEEE